MSATDASNAIMAALSTVSGLTVTNNPGASLSSFPAAVVNVPQLAWTEAAYGEADPNEATFLVFVVVKSDGYVLPALEAAIAPVVEALWTVQDLVVTQALTGVFPQGTTDLPCYIVTCEVSL